jgi:hypothetical protein
MRNIADDLGAHVEFMKGKPGHTVSLELPLSVCLNRPSPVLECSRS